MKEKLVKNHYKGFDKKIHVFGYACIGLLFASVCTFLPLTAMLEAKVQTVQVEKSNTKTTDKSTNSTAKEKFSIIYAD